MEPQLLPLDLDSDTSNHTNYTSGIITRKYLLDGKVFYFMLHPELYPDENGLDFTGRYLAVFTSIRGLESFWVTPEIPEVDMEEGWEEKPELKPAFTYLPHHSLTAPYPDEDDDDDDDDLYDEDGNLNEDDLEEPSEAELKFLNFHPAEKLLPLMIQAIEEFRNP